MKVAPVVLVSILVLTTTSCITVPKESVTLAENMAQETATLQAAHEALVGRYYGLLRDRVDQFLTDVWIPAFLDKAVQNAAVQKQLGDALAAADVNSATIQQKINSDPSLTPAEKTVILNALSKAAVGGRAQLGQVMIAFGKEATRQITKQRNAMLDPINAQETLALNNLRQSYAQLQGEQATVKAFLASAVNVREAEDTALQRLGLLEQRNQALNLAAQASDDAARLLQQIQGAESNSAITDFINALNAANERLRGSSPPPPPPPPPNGGTP